MTSFRDRLAEFGAEADIVTVVRLAARLADAAATADPNDTLPALTALLDGDDVDALAAVEALARVPDDQVSPTGRSRVDR